MKPFLEEHRKDSTYGFRSGVPALDSFFAKHAFANDRRGIGKTFVLHGQRGGGAPRVLGFYTLSMASVEVGFLPKKLRRGLPKYPMPVALLGRLAVDERAQKLGLGRKLLVDAFRRVTELADRVGCFGVIVDAKNPQAEKFYQKYGFQGFEKSTQYPCRLFLPMKTLRAALAGG